MTLVTAPLLLVCFILISLNKEPNFANPDDFYEALIDMHKDLSEEQSHKVNARLILLLANHIGDLSILRTAMSDALVDL